MGNAFSIEIVGDSRPLIRHNALTGVWMALRLTNCPNPIDARENLWGGWRWGHIFEPSEVNSLDDSSSIGERIWDATDEDGLGVVTVAPWLTDGRAVATAVLEDSWGQIKYKLKP